MEYRSLGRTGVQVSPLCLGGMLFGEQTDEAEALTIIDRALDAGLNFVDTANIYNRGRSEEIIGRALRRNGRRARVVLATKVHGRMDDHDPNAWGNSRRHILEQCEASLRRLQTDVIDLYQLHRPLSTIPIDETLRALDDLVRSGKVRYLGTSTFAAWQLVEALWVSKELGLHRVVCEQPPYHLLDRRIERELVPMAQTYGLALLPWPPLAGGFLSGKHRRGQAPPPGSRLGQNPEGTDPHFTDATFRVLEAVTALAHEKAITPSQLALAWVAQQPGVTSAIIGPRTRAHLDDCLGAMDVQLTAEDRARLDAAAPPGQVIVPYLPNLIPEGLDGAAGRSRPRRGASAPRPGAGAHDGGRASLRRDRQPGHGRWHHGSLWGADCTRGSCGAGLLALAMQASVQQYASEIQRTRGVPIHIRVGLNAGEVVVRSIGSDLHMDYTAVGHTTHLAARTEQMALPGSILITSEVLRLAEGYVQVQSLGPVAVKGLSAPVEVSELVGAGPVRSRLQAAAIRGLTRFVGRHRELDHLSQALEWAGSGRGQLVALLDVPMDEADWPRLDPSQRRQRTLEALTRLLLRASQRQPLLVIVEDLHWLDAETQACLDRLVESLPTARLLLLVNYHPEYQHGWGGKTYYTQLRLDPLPSGALGEGVHSLP